jgi:hypothetical protein
MKYLQYIFVLALSLTLVQCQKAETIDEVLPVIEISSVATFPHNCDTVYRGESFQLVANFSDNVELGSYSVDIHHNFDHHTHSTAGEACSMDPIKTPVNPFLLIKSFYIPSGSKAFQSNQSIQIPNDIDTGDYHLMIRLTDKEGWQAIEGLSIKIENR